MGDLFGMLPLFPSKDAIEHPFRKDDLIRGKWRGIRVVEFVVPGVTVHDEGPKAVEDSGWGRRLLGDPRVGNQGNPLGVQGRRGLGASKFGV